MERAIELAAENVRAGGGPFAALVVKGGVAIASGVNRVTLANDPTAHAEIVADPRSVPRAGRLPARRLRRVRLLRTLPMCLGALYWARPARIFFAATRDDAAAAGFDDAFIYRELAAPASDRAIPLVRLSSARAARPFKTWLGKPDRTKY